MDAATASYFNWRQAAGGGGGRRTRQRPTRARLSARARGDGRLSKYARGDGGKDGAADRRATFERAAWSRQTLQARGCGAPAPPPASHCARLSSPRACVLRTPDYRTLASCHRHRTRQPERTQPNPPSYVAAARLPYKYTPRGRHVRVPPLQHPFNPPPHAPTYTPTFSSAIPAFLLSTLTPPSPCPRLASLGFVRAHLESARPQSRPVKRPSACIYLPHMLYQHTNLHPTLPSPLPLPLPLSRLSKNQRTNTQREGDDGESRQRVLDKVRLARTD